MNKDKKKQADELLRMLERNIDKNDSYEVLRKSLLEQLIEVMRSSQYDCRLGYAYMKVVISNKADHPVETVYILLDKKQMCLRASFLANLEPIIVLPIRFQMMWRNKNSALLLKHIASSPSLLNASITSLIP